MAMFFSTITALAIAYSSGGGGDGTGQSCDAVNICSTGTCPTGMDKVGRPERSDVYTIRTAQGTAADAVQYTPGGLLSLWITVEKPEIQKRLNAGTRVCWCDGLLRRKILKEDCLPFAATSGPTKGTITQCSEPKMEQSKYIGLLLYAVDAQERKVGSWDIMDTFPRQFWTPPDPLCGGASVMHVDAEKKAFVNEFIFRAPPAGAGPLTFRALLKQGDTNGGQFYWPIAPASGASKMGTPKDGVAGGDLTLTEAAGAAAPTQIWFRATAAGQSCDNVCTANGNKVCDLAALQSAAVRNAAGPVRRLQTATKPFYATNQPAVGACSAALPAIADTSEGWLFFHKTVSSAANTCSPSELTTPSCSAVPTEDTFKLRRLCPCKTSRRRLTFIPPHSLLPHKSGNAKGSSVGCPHYTPPGGRRRLGANVATSRSVAPLATSLALGALASLSGGGRLATTLIPLVLFAASQLPRAAAHNWIYNPTTRASASGRASTVQPCRTRRTNIPDVHVNPGQEFEIEWSTGHGNPAGSGSHYFTLIKAEDEDKLPFVTTGLIDDYIDSALSSQHMLPKAKWAKRHWSWNHTQEGSPKKLGDFHAVPDAQMISEGFSRSDPWNVDPYYIERPDSFKCVEVGRHKNSPTSGACYEVAGGLTQWTYAAAQTAGDGHVEYANAKYPWIVQAHRITTFHNHAHHADIARFLVNGDPGEYIMHWWWAGYADCIDIAVMPPAIPVPKADASRYGVTTEDTFFSRVDHCQWGSGKADRMRITGNPNKPYCYVIPANGKVNAKGDTRAESLAKCKVHAKKACCGTTRHMGMNVVPLLPPALAHFTTDAERGIPWGFSDCTKVEFAKEASPEDSMVCYPVWMEPIVTIEGQWSVVKNDLSDPIWYSTCYIIENKRTFELTTPCMDYVTAKWPNGMCTMERVKKWQHGDQCISCAAMEANADASAMLLPTWLPLSADECKMCNYAAPPNVPAPTPAPTVPASEFDASTVWANNWTSPDGAIFVGWKEGGLDPADTEAAEALTFVLFCATCDETGWVAIGINPGTTTAQMIGTSAIIWKMDEGTIREYDVNSKAPTGVVPWSAERHVGRVAIDLQARRATFSIGAGANPSREWSIAGAQISQVSEDTNVMFAYCTSGGFVQHTSRGAVQMLLRITEGPIAGEATNAATAGGGADATEKDTTAQQTLLALLIFVGVNALIALVVVLLGTVLIVVVVRSRRKFHELEPDAKAAIVAKVQQGTKMQSMGGNSSFASEPRGLATRDSSGVVVRGVAAMDFAPRVPPNKPSRAPQKPALRKPAPKKPTRKSGPSEEDSSSTKTKKKKKKKKKEKKMTLQGSWASEPVPKKPARPTEGDSSSTKTMKKKKKKKKSEISSSVSSSITNPDRVRRARPLSGI